MKRTGLRRRLCAALLILNLLFIWGNSALPGAVSARLSLWVQSFLFPHSAVLPAVGTGLLRKLAHFTEFACLGSLLCWRLGMAGCSRKNLILLPLFGGMTAACIDETVQIFIEGRGSSLVDVWIDTAGAAVGIGLMLTGHHIVHQMKMNRRTTK